MRNNPTSGTDTGLPAGLARRSFLASLPGVFGAAAAAAALPGAAAALPRAAGPSPAIAELSEAVARVEGDYLTTVGKLREAIDTWSPSWPIAPDNICLPYAASLAPAERGLDDQPIVRERGECVRGVRTKENLQDLTDYAYARLDKVRLRMVKGETKHRLKQLEGAERGLDDALRAQSDRVAYDAHCQAVLEASGVKSLAHSRDRAAVALVRMVREILSQPALNGADVGAQAAAVARLASLQNDDRAFVVLGDTQNGAEPLVLMLARAVAGLDTA